MQARGGFGDRFKPESFSRWRFSLEASEGFFKVSEKKQNLPLIGP
jgi:hypothetical protein